MRSGKYLDIVLGEFGLAGNAVYITDLIYLIAEKTDPRESML